ncbi:hypothetical protein [Leifsonia shinshuensis]|uniref:Uncharacterized protein n=1 Tax=Leifsonia shinshuensis TaxID=150026 RepID=A0A853CSY8_9MICO|nr:hypothetical protein [Leifsonia shinshuensis]NYJ23478.1 hypothetical protein [Leifsonia shinshuensis]
MGAHLVGKAFAFAAANDLKPNEFRLLIFMALTALDSDQPPRYFASREESAYGLGRMVEDKTTLDPRAIGARDAAFWAVKTAVQGLVKSGAIERKQRGRNGRRAEFVLTFRGGQSHHQKGGESHPGWGGDSHLEGVGNSTPQGTTEEPQEELQRRTPRFTEASHLQPVDNSDERQSA